MCAYTDTQTDTQTDTDAHTNTQNRRKKEWRNKPQTEKNICKSEI